jgi:neutral amino acid transport system ATP-binding protein
VAEAPTALLRLDDVVSGYFRDVPILNGVHVEVGPRQMISIVGPNGAGKSTLVKVVIGLLRPWRGSVRLDGVELAGRKPHEIVRLGVGYVAQRQNVFPTMSVFENLELGAVAARGRDGGRDRVVELLSLFPRLAERRRQLAGTLSGGERQLLALARALVPDPKLLVLDEPSAGLAPQAVDRIFAEIAAIHERGVAIVMVEQNARRALALAHRGYVLDMGRNAFSGPGPQLLHDPKVAELYLGGSSTTASSSNSTSAPSGTSPPTK